MKYKWKVDLKDKNLEDLENKHLENILVYLWDSICPEEQILKWRPIFSEHPLKTTEKCLQYIYELFRLLNDRKKGGFPHKQSKDWNFVSNMLKKNQISDYRDLANFNTFRKENSYLKEKRERQEKLLNEL